MSLNMSIIRHFIFYTSTFQLLVNQVLNCYHRNINLPSTYTNCVNFQKCKFQIFKAIMLTLLQGRTVTNTVKSFDV